MSLGGILIINLSPDTGEGRRPRRPPRTPAGKLGKANQLEPTRPNLEQLVQIGHTNWNATYCFPQSHLNMVSNRRQPMAAFAKSQLEQ